MPRKEKPVMWKFVGDCEPLPGIGPGPLTAEEFAEKVAAYEAQFSGDQRGAVERSGLYARDDEPAAAEAEAVTEEAE